MFKLSLLLALPVLLLVAVAFAQAPQTPATPLPDASDFHKAASIALQRVSTDFDNPQSYKLIGLQQTVVRGKYVWRATFKPSRLLPPDPSKQEIGFGYEIFVHMDLASGNTYITRGE